MEIRQLEIFRVIAEELHFGRAAERLFLAQPTVSQALQRLEAEVGVVLVYRSSRRVSLTPAGEVFLAETARILHSVESAIAVTRQAGAGRRGLVRISTNYPASRLLLLPLLELLHEEQPGITAKLRETGTPEQLDLLQRDEVDLALLYGPIAEKGIESVHLLDVPVVASVRAGHPLADAAAIDLSRVPDFPYLTGVSDSGDSIAQALIRVASIVGVRLRHRSDVRDLASSQLAIETTDTIGFSSLTSAKQNEAIGLRVLRIAPVEPVLELYLAWNAAVREPLVNIVRDRLIRLSADLRQAS